MWRRHWALFGQDPISTDPSLPMFAEARMHESTLWVESFLRWFLLGEFPSNRSQEFSMCNNGGFLELDISLDMTYVSTKWPKIGLFDCFLLFFLFAFYCVIAVGMENRCPHYWNHICMYGVNGYEVSEAHFNTISPSNGLIRPLFLR